MFKKTSQSSQTPAVQAPPWRILIVDDEPEVHTITRLTLGDLSFSGRPMEFLSAESAAQAREILDRESDIALAFVDVVMETDEAGLDLVTYIRTELKNTAIRIILRTGQPGKAPERQVIRDFEINDYISKTSASADKLFTSTLTALRAYDGVIALELSNRRLERYREGLEKVIVASANLFEHRSLRLFACGLLRQISGLLFHTEGSLLLSFDGLTVAKRDTNIEVLAKTGRFEAGQISGLPAQVMAKLEQTLENKRSMVINDTFVGYFPTKNGIINMSYLDGISGIDSVDLKLIEIFSKNIGAAFENLYLDQEIYDTQAEIITTLGDVMETRSHESANHVRRVAHLATMMARDLSLPDEECDLIRGASPMHDIGKVAIPDGILLKPGPLNDLEWTKMKEHASIGESIFSRSNRPIFKTAAIIAGQHHERFDGSGYPRGLRSDEIHLHAQIVGLIDVFDALAHRRCYKDPWPMEKILELIRNERGQQFDPMLVDCFLDNFSSVCDILNTFPDSGAVTHCEANQAS